MSIMYGTNGIETNPHHKLDCMFDRQNVKLFPIDIHLSLKKSSEASGIQFEEVVHQFDQHMQGLAYSTRNSGSILTFCLIASFDVKMQSWNVKWKM